MKLAFLSVPAGDFEASQHFYTNILSLTPVRHHDGEPHRYVDYDLGAAVLKVFEWREPWQAGPYTSFMLETARLDAVLEKARAAGYETRPPEITRWGGRIAAIVDPFGNIINLLDGNQRGTP